MAVGGVRMRCGLGCLTRWADQAGAGAVGGGRWQNLWSRPVRPVRCGDLGRTWSAACREGLVSRVGECSRTGPLRFLAGGGPGSAW